MRMRNYINIKTQKSSREYEPSMQLLTSQYIQPSVEKLFPKNPEINFYSYKKSNEFFSYNLPRHTRDKKWLAKYIACCMETKKVYVDYKLVLDYLQNSKEFDEKRHEYELNLVKYQILKYKNGEWSSLPDHLKKFSLPSNSIPNKDLIFRQYVENSLQAIGLCKDVIEEGLEKYSNLWRDYYMGISYDYRYVYLERHKDEPSHKSNWLAMRKYEYYLRHKASVEKYGQIDPCMLMEEGELKALKTTLKKQNSKFPRILPKMLTLKVDKSYGW